MLISLGTAFALVFSAGVAAHQAGTAARPQAAGDDDDVTLTGCVVKGDGGYVLTDVVSATSDPHTGHPAHAATPTATGGVPADVARAIAARTLYWLEDDEEVEKFAGQRVEVKGDLEGDIDKGKVSIEREQGMVELEFKSEDERTITVKLPDLPAAIGTTGAVTDREKDHDFIVRKLDVESVKMIAATCR
jgi:hypothetical protein